MTTCNKLRFSSKVFAHLDIKYHMTSNILIFWRKCNLLISWRKLWCVFPPNLKIRPDVLHFFLYGLPPKGIGILFIKWLCLLHWLGDLEAKLVRSNPIIWPHISNDVFALRQHMLDLPCTFWVTCNTELYRILSHLHEVWVLRIIEGHTCCDPILPLDEGFNPLCCLFASFFFRYALWWMRTSNLIPYCSPYGQQYHGIGYANFPLHSLDMIISSITMGIIFFCPVLRSIEGMGKI